MPIEILSINLIGAEDGVDQFDESEHTLPMVNDNETDLIWDAWEGIWRDVFILDKENRIITTYNLTSNNLGTPENYLALKTMLVEAAGATMPEEYGTD